MQRSAVDLAQLQEVAHDHARGQQLVDQRDRRAAGDLHDAPLVLRQAHEEALRGEVPDFHFVGPRAGHARDELHEGGLRRAVLHLQHDAAVGLAGKIGYCAQSL